MLEIIEKYNIGYVHAEENICFFFLETTKFF